MKWQIYYEDGSTFSDVDGEPCAAPGYGVLCLWQPRQPLYSADYYVYRTDYGSWVEVKLDGLIDHLVPHAPEVVAVKAGRAVPLAVWKAAMARMTEAHDGHS